VADTLVGLQAQSHQDTPTEILVIIEKTIQVVEEQKENSDSFFYAAFTILSSMSYGILFLLSISSSMAYIMFMGS